VFASGAPRFVTTGLSCGVSPGASHGFRAGDSRIGYDGRGVRRREKKRDHSREFFDHPVRVIYIHGGWQYRPAASLN
jgi:hypothetical protein